MVDKVLPEMTILQQIYYVSNHTEFNQDMTDKMLTVTLRLNSIKHTEFNFIRTRTYELNLSY